MRVPVAEMEKTDITPDTGYSIYAERVANMMPVTPAVSKQTIPSRQKPLPPIDQKTMEDDQAVKYEKKEKVIDDLDIKKQTLQYYGPEVKTMGQFAADERVSTVAERPQEQAYGDHEMVKTRKMKINFMEDIEDGVLVKEEDEVSEEYFALERPTLMQRGKVSSLERYVALRKPIHPQQYIIHLSVHPFDLSLNCLSIHPSLSFTN